MKAKHTRKKGCVLYVVHISSDKDKEIEDAYFLSRYPALQQFEYVFLAKISDLPPHREVDFSIELVPRVAPTSKSPYKMSTTKLVEFNLSLMEMLEKGYIRPSVSSWGEPIFLVKKKDGTLRLCIDYM